MQPPDGLLQNRYRVVSPLGRGGMGAVYKAVDERFGRTVALKQALIASDWLSRAFEREAKLLNTLRHTALPVVIDYFQEDESWYLVMDYVPGDDLGVLLGRRRHAFLLDDVLRWGEQLLTVVEYLHSHRPPVLHRDIKPQNLKLNANGEIVLLDFGLAKGSDFLTESGGSSVNAFTPHYASFEQIRGVGADERSDLYAVAATLYHLATGRIPVDALERVGATFCGLADPLLPAASVHPLVPVAVSDVLTQAMAMSPSERPPTAARMLRMLDAARASNRGRLPATETTAQLAPTRDLALDTADVSPKIGMPATYVAGRSPAHVSTVSEEARDTAALGNLPRQMTNFVGRGSEVAEVLRLLEANPLVTLIGVGGMGKTRLALEVATAAAAEFPDGVWFVELGKVLNPSFVPQAIGAVLEIREDVEGSLLAKVATSLRRQKLLLVVDNCEHLVESSGAAVEAILRACPDVRVLATSREALGLGGEIVRSVAPLTTPDPENLPPSDELLLFEAVRLFVDRARLGKPSFAVTSRNARAIAEICRRLDGVPLAIELAASRVKMLPIDQILTRLNDRFEFLVRGPRAALPHQQTLRTTIDWSYNLLVDEEKVLLRRLAVFGGGFTLDAAEAICAGGEIESGAVAYSLERLVDKSLVITDEADESTRFRMLETVHQYAVELLAESGEEATMRTAHLAWYTRFAEMTNSQFNPDEVNRWIAKFRAEDYNLEAAKLWARAERAEGLVFSLVEAQYRYWYASENWDKFRRWLMTPMPSLPAELKARVAFLRGSFEYLRGRYETAETLFQECLGAELEPKRRLNALTHLGAVESHLGKSDRARELYEEALAIGREIGDEHEVASAELSLAALDKLPRE